MHTPHPCRVSAAVVMAMMIGGELIAEPPAKPPNLTQGNTVDRKQDVKQAIEAGRFDVDCRNKTAEELVAAFNNWSPMVRSRELTINCLIRNFGRFPQCRITMSGVCRSMSSKAIS
ncbi:MAG: hypothetical protein K9N23_19250 [Akkermansiaceae bacterium]|nr:hypothetical protein [Akkermansiaceae bacterium]